MPVDYDRAYIAGTPSDLDLAGYVIGAYVWLINDSLGWINQYLSELRLSWTSNSQQLADDFTNRWNNMMTELYGSQDGSTPGIFNTVAMGVQMAAQNYEDNEQNVSKQFYSFSSGSSSPNTHSNSDTVTDTYYHTTSVNETDG